MSWIKTLSYDEADSKLRKVYDRIKDKEGNIDNILKSHSLRPHTLVGHMTLYKNVLHHSGNTLPKWFLETIGVYVSMLNKCSYCVDHHFAGLQKLLKADTEKAIAIFSALEKNELEHYFIDKELILLQYAKKLTLLPSSIKKTDIELLQNAGIDDGEILEVNQVTAYFCYANRTVLGLGVNTDGDELGLSPGNSNNPDDWSHT